MANSAGTHFFWEDEVGNRYYGVISDLTSVSIARLGETDVTIAGTQVTGFTDATISPVLEDATLTNWRVIGSPRQTTAMLAPTFSFVSTSLLRVRLNRSVIGSASSLSGVTVGAGGDLIDVNVTTANPHGSDVGVGPHGHTIAAHPINDPGHFHNLVASTGPVTVTVDWIIIHI